MIIFKNTSNQSVITTLNTNEEHANLIHNKISDKEDTVRGVIKPHIL